MSSSSAQTTPPATAASTPPSSSPTLGPAATPITSPVVPSCLSALGAAPQVDSLPALQQLAAQLHVLTTVLPTTQSQQTVIHLEDSVHTSLARLDELSALLESFKQGSAHGDQQLLPLLLARSEQLQPLFQKVHTFDKYASELERHLTYVEGRVEEVEVVLKRTAAMEQEYAKNKETIAASRNGVNAELREAEKSVRQLWSSLKNLGSKSSSSTPAPTASSTAQAAANNPTILDLVDAWTPFEPLVDIDEFYTPKVEPAKAAVPKKTGRQVLAEIAAAED